MPALGLPELFTTALIWAIFLVPIVVIGRLLIRGLRRPDPAIDTLRTRFANGDIDAAEYERLRTTLQRS